MSSYCDGPGNIYDRDDPHAINNIKSCLFFNREVKFQNIDTMTSSQDTQEVSLVKLQREADEFSGTFSLVLLREDRHSRCRTKIGMVNTPLNPGESFTQFAML